MAFRNTLTIVVILTSAAQVLAQTASEPGGSGKPASLNLPVGARVRVETTAKGGRMTGFLAGGDATSLAIVPEGAPPLESNELRLPKNSVTRLEMQTGKKRQWLLGLAIGALAGGALGFLGDVDPERCKYDDNYSCSRAESVGLTAAGGAMIGVVVGGLVKSDQWTAVPIESLGSPAPRVSGLAPRLRALPRGGAGLELAVGF